MKYTSIVAAALLATSSAKTADMLQGKKENFAKVTQGLLTSYGGKFDLEALLFCIYDEDQAALMVDVAYQAFQQFLQATTTEDKIGGLVGTAIGLYGGYQQFEQGLPACEHVWTSDSFKKVEKDMTAMKGSFKNITEVTNRLMTHSKELIEQAENVQGDMEKFGELFGAILKTITEEPVTEAKDNREAITEMLQGFFEGTNVGTFNFTNLLICIYEEDQAAIALYEAVQLFEQAWGDKDWTEAVGGVIATVAAVQGAEQGLPACEAVDSTSYNWGEFNKLAAMTKKETVKVVEKNLVFNGVTISDDVIKAMKSYEGGDYKDFGFKLGNALLLATKTEQKDLFLY